MTAATLVLSAITLALLIATVTVLARTRAAIAQVRADARRELGLLRRQLAAGERPILLDVLPNSPVAPDMDGETRFPGLEPRGVDPRDVFVALDEGKLYISVPLRNAGGGPAVLDGGGVTLSGPRVGDLEYRSVRREHIPASETTRVDLIADHETGEAPGSGVAGSAMRSVAWELTVPYSDLAGERQAVSRFQIVCRGDDAEGPWLVERVAHELPHARGAQTDDFPDGTPPARTDDRPQRAGIRNEPVVDLWGNPVRPKRRSR